MLINTLFHRDINRAINGVVKADQLDESSVWQELDEFVVTKELTEHFRTFFTRYCDALGRTADPEAAEKMGVWISGFFGSGKSHFIKVLSYLLENKEHTYKGQTKRAVDFFESKIEDAMLFGDIKRAVETTTDVILFNIDSKADASAGRDAILAVFLKVLNEHQGYSGDHHHVAHMERYLDGEGKLEAFHKAYTEATGDSWVEERDAYEFNRDEVVQALSKALGQSPASCETWVDSAESNFALTVENFAKWTREFLDSKGPDHRLMFLVDEVGQYIGSNRPLMLNLQTITEQLGTVCEGRAWVVVTSQEDIDAVLGEIKTTKANDFSKIQGRFKTRFSLSSQNVDEVIQERLLRKTPKAEQHLDGVFKKKGDVLKNQLTFKNVGMTFKKIKDSGDFACNYPFVPYQFSLLQKIFESIRKAGATGLHLAQGERSLLDAFQSAAKAVGESDAGKLVPLYLFYPSIQSFLDTAVKRTIDQAKHNASLEPFDATLLQVLFLIRYVEELRGNLDNLVTLCVDEIDADRIGLRRKIEASLLRLEKETLISHSGENYVFLTNEERDVGRDIKTIGLSSGEEAKLLGDLIFDDTLKGTRKHRYKPNGKDFSFTRLCDDQAIGNRIDGGLVVSVVTPLGDEYERYTDSQCTMDSGSKHDGHVVIKLANVESLGREIRAYLQTDKYLRTKDTATLTTATKRIHRDLAEDNRERRDRLGVLLGTLVAEARYFVFGAELSVKSANPTDALDEALDYLIKNSFHKMHLLETLQDNPLPEIQAVLRSDDIAQQSMAMGEQGSNPKALADLQAHLALAQGHSRQIVLHDLINVRFANRPYGWPQMEVALLVARLLAVGEIQLIKDSSTVAKGKIYEILKTPSKWRSVKVMPRITATPEVIRKARKLGKEVFAEMGPEGEDALFEFLTRHLRIWQSNLDRYKTMAETGDYPGRDNILENLAALKSLIMTEESVTFFARFHEQRADLVELSESYADLEQFYEHQRTTWDKLTKALQRFELNKAQLERDEDAIPGLRRLREIRSAKAPWGIVKDVTEHITGVDAVNTKLIAHQRNEVGNQLSAFLINAKSEANAVKADATTTAQWLAPLKRLTDEVKSQTSIAHIQMAERTGVEMLDQVIEKAAAFVPEKQGDPNTPPPPTLKPVQNVKASDLVQTTYLETAEQVNGYVDALRQSLLKAIESHRIKIR